jgi:hypothetical protein
MDTILCVLLSMPVASATAEMSFKVYWDVWKLVIVRLWRMTGYPPWDWYIFTEILKWTCTKQWRCSYLLRHEGQIFDNFKIFLSISHSNCAWFYVIWNPEMAPDRTILHFVENNYGVHTIKPQLPYVPVYKSRLHERWINFLLRYIWMRWMFITNIYKTLNTCSKHIKNF